MKKSKRIIIICIAAFLIIAGIIVIVSRHVPKGDVSVRGYETINGKRVETSHQEYFLDDNGRITKEIVAGDKGISSITENEYDSLGRLICTKCRSKGFLFFDDIVNTETYSYYKDSELLTDYVKNEKYKDENNEKAEDKSEKHMEYDAEGRLVSKETVYNIWNYRMQSDLTKYNTNGIVIYQEETIDKKSFNPFLSKNDGKPMVITEYDPDAKIIRNYYCGISYLRGAAEAYEFTTYADLRELTSEIQLTDDGKYDTIKYFSSDEDEEGMLQTSLTDVVYYDYSPEDERAEYETTMYNANGELIQRELFDKQGECIVSVDYENGEEKSRSESEYEYDKQGRRIVYIEYEDGVESYRIESDYDAEDPELPGEKVYYHRRYEADENGNMALCSETWEKKISYGIFEEIEDNDNDGLEVYRSYWIINGVKKPETLCSFQDNGFIKEKHKYVYHGRDINADETEFGYGDDFDESAETTADNGSGFEICVETIYEYDEYGNCLKQWEKSEDGERVLKYEWEYTYRK